MHQILLIHPKYKNKEIIYFPLGLGYVAAACYKQGIEVSCIDMNVSNIDNLQILSMIAKQQFHVVGIGGFLMQLKSTIELTNLIKNRLEDVTVIIGGIQVYGCEKFIMDNSKADIVCVGESEIILPELIDALYTGRNLSAIPSIIFREKGKVVKNNGPSLIMNLDEIDFPKYDIFNMEIYATQNYHGFSGKQTIDFICSRGCPYRCNYCINSMKPVKARYRSPENILKEIRFLKENYNINDFSFADEIFTINKQKALEICEAIQGENITWVTSTRADLLDRDVLSTMKKAGLRMLIIGFESGSEKILRSMNKRVALSKYYESIKLLQKYDIPFYSNFMIGMPEENESTLKETETFCIDNKLIFGASYVTPFPGTKLYDDVRHKIGDEKKYIYSVAEMNFSKKPIINLTEMPAKKLIHHRNKMTVNTIVYLIHNKFRLVPRPLLNITIWCCIFIFNQQNALLSKVTRSISKKLLFFLRKTSI